MRSPHLAKLHQSLSYGIYPFLLEQAKLDPRVKSPEKRARWDMLWAAGISNWVCDELYQYLNDTHLDTALRYLVDERFRNICEADMVLERNAHA